MGLEKAVPVTGVTLNTSFLKVIYLAKKVELGEEELEVLHELLELHKEELLLQDLLELQKEKKSKKEVNVIQTPTTHQLIEPFSFN